MDATSLLSGPRGRHLCLAVAQELHEPVRRAWFGSDVGAMREALGEVETVPIRGWEDPLAFVEAMDSAVSSGMGWQEPHDEDVVAADPIVVRALEPVAAAIAASPAALWWSDGVDLAALRYASRTDPGDRPTPPRLVGIGRLLAEWRAKELADDRRARDERADDPRAAISGRWWSMPSDTDPPSTTRPLAHIGAVKLLWEEDSFGQWDAAVWTLRPVRNPRVYEIDGPEAWAELVRRYPLDVTWSRRHDWYRVTGEDRRWSIPDWAAVGRDWDGVHLTVAGYLATATRLIEVDGGSATVLAGWDPDQTWWLTDVLEADEHPVQWMTSQDFDGVLLGWHPVSGG